MRSNRRLVLSWLVLVVLWHHGSIFNHESLSFGDDDSVTLRYRPRRFPATPFNSIEQLKLPWNSESEADWPVAEQMAAISKLSYLAPVEAEQGFQSLGFRKTRHFKAETLNGYVISADDVAVVAFRGTDDLSEWLVNLGALSYYTPQGDIHEGYYRAYRSLKPQIMNLLHECKPRKIWITGHSLGGALALVCAYDLITQERTWPYGLMTFGQPMVTDQFLADYLDRQLLGRYIHFVNETDIVPRLPPGFAHCGSLVWFINGQVRRSPPKRRVHAALANHPEANHEGLLQPLSEQEFADLQDELREAAAVDGPPIRNTAFTSRTPEWIRDHSMTLYLKKIERAQFPFKAP